jgi:DNA-binding winged helix-turn-helix (wHTH) protein
MQPASRATILRFGVFELDLEAQQLSRAGRIVRLQPQPFKLLCLLAAQAGKVVSRDEIRSALWSGDTFVDFDQGVNFAVRQVRDALGEDADNPVYIQTVPKRGYKFVAPVTEVTGEAPPVLDSPTQELHKLMWANISELRMAEERRKRRRRVIQRALIIGGISAIVLLGAWLLVAAAG